MDSYITKRKYRCRNIINRYTGKLIVHKYQRVRLSFAFKNYKIKNRNKEQMIVIDIDLLFPANKLVMVFNKNSLIRKIKTNYLESSIKFLKFSQFNTDYKSNKFKDVIDLKKLKMRLRGEDLEYIFKNIIGSTLIIDDEQKELIFKDESSYFFSQLDFQKHADIDRVNNYFYYSGYIAEL